jgi:Zn-dependent M16 (insulinase) family peptidase
LPTLSEAGACTEVHHIDEHGRDAGVVYAEMESCTHERDHIVRVDAFRQIYPEGNGYRYEKGGLCEDIREITCEKIRQFHKNHYQPRNLRIAVYGQVNSYDLLQLISKFESSIIQYVPSLSDTFLRPWFSNLPESTLTKSITKICEIPGKMGDPAYIFISIIGPFWYDLSARKELKPIAMTTY